MTRLDTALRKWHETMRDAGNQLAVLTDCPRRGERIAVPIELVPAPVHPVGEVVLKMQVITDALDHICPPGPGREPLPETG